MKAEVMRAFSGFAEHYDHYMEETCHVQAQQKVAGFLAQGFKGHVLDVATGTGIMLEPFEEGVGVDISLSMVQRAKRKHPSKEFVVADVHKLPFRDKAFDVSISCLAFLWFDDPEKALSEMLRVAGKAYVVEEEGTPARKRIDVPEHLKQFFEMIGRLEKEINVEELAYRSSLMYGRVFEADIDGSHKFVVYEVMR
ncbi:MAG: class I SAM-dependent methyltransferase [Desulfitobacteriaceae bacterium]|nr:class I SAM-dependent methyltransferase [Desulfitobacteriaceae bacterium]